MSTLTNGSLTAELTAIETEFPGWHLFTSDAGNVWAATTENHSGGSGTTLDAPTPALMRHAIAEQQHHWARGSAAA